MGDLRTVSIVKIVPHSPRVEKLKVKKINKRFVPELKKVVSVSRDSACICICYTSNDTKLKLLVMLWSQSSGRCGVPLHCHYFLAHTDPEW